MKVTIGKYPKNSKKERKVKVQIDDWDTWNMDSTLALIVLPMLKQVKDGKSGAPFVHDEDVPEHLRRNIPWDTEHHQTDELWFARWEYVLNEMIFAFESYTNNWEDQFWNETDTECNWDARNQYAERIQRGFELFGRYYQGLWT